MTDQAAPTAPTAASGESAMDGVRKRSVFVLRAVLIALAAGGVLLVGQILAALHRGVVQNAVQFRAAVHLPVPAAGIDWYLLTAMLAVPGLLTAAVLVTWFLYRRAWRRRMLAVWGGRKAARRYQRIADLPEAASGGHRAEKTSYAEALLASPAWSERRHVVPAGVQGTSYEPVAEAVFADIENDVAARALAVGLVVGVGGSPLIDLGTIAAASIEIQLHVMARLGKRPRLRHWVRLANAGLASLFVNTYLNRADAFAVNLAIRKAALGIEVTGEALQSAAERLDHALNDGHLDVADIDADEISGSLGPVASIVGEAAMFGLTVGSVALQQIARFVERYGNEMVQGAIAGGILYWQGVSLAADILAVDRAHRDSPALRRTVRQGANTVARNAGEILRASVQELRGLYRRRKVMAVKGIGELAKSGGMKVGSAVSDLFRRFKREKEK